METGVKSLAAAAVLAALLATALFQAARPVQAVQLPKKPDVPVVADCGNLPKFSADESLKLRLLREECRSRQSADAYAAAWKQTLGK